MNSSYLARRLETLRRAQNSDGGWSYYSGKKDSWLEPTVYAALALDGQPEAARAWDLVKGWQDASGGWRPAANVAGANWTSALGVLLASIRGRDAAVSARGLDWLRKAALNGAWAWRSGAAVAAEPTALAMIALAKGGGKDRESQALLGSGRAFLLGADIRPETCGAVLTGLQGSKEAASLLGLAAEWAESSPSRLTRAWIALGRRLNGEEFEAEESDPGGKPAGNLSVLALEALAAPGGNHTLFHVEVMA